MSIYDRSVGDLTRTDVTELLTERARENVRLEFKREDPGRQEYLKKLSSFANTYGGYLVLGASANAETGELTALPGVERIAGFSQRIVQWCQEWLTPPVRPYVSAPIPMDEAASRYCYVVFVEESMEAPHFINSRQGAYVRTDELSRRFQPQLATYEEILHLSGRRAAALQRRRDLLARANGRFGEFIAQDYENLVYTAGTIGATLKLSLCPRLPVLPLCEQATLRPTLEAAQLPWRQVVFGRADRALTQHESVLVLEPAGGFSLLEVSTWGHLFYAVELECLENNRRAIHLNFTTGHLLLFLEHAARCLERLGFDGTVSIIVKLERIRGIPFVTYPNNTVRFGPASRFDDEVEFELTATLETLVNGRHRIVRRILATIFFASNWPDLGADEPALDQVLDAGQGYNNFGR